MAKIKGKDILDRIKKKEEADRKENVTFSLSVRLMTAFRKRCKDSDVALNTVLEELLGEFLAP
jgi:hypothetical protein